MIDTYYIDVTQFENENLFQEKFKQLSPYRQRKLARLKQEKDRMRSLGAGVALDHALAAYGLEEGSVMYEIGEWGKPSLKNHPDIHFSLSHSGDYAICSIGNRPVGNDIERIKAGRLKVADRFFTPEELKFMYAAQEEAEIVQRMFRIWTMKESFLKATGRGISLPLNNFSIAIDEEKNEIRVKHTFNEMSYRMKEYSEIPGYRVAVCCEESEDMADDMADDMKMIAL